MAPPDEQLTAIAQRLSSALDELRRFSEALGQSEASPVRDDAARLVAEISSGLVELIQDLESL